MRVSVRTMRVDDIDGMVDVFDQVVASHPSYISHSELQNGVLLEGGALNPARFAIWRQSFEELFADYPGGQFVATDDVSGAVVGFQVVEQVIGPYSRYGILQDLCVLPVYRGGGVGQRLFEAALARLSQDGITRIFFESGIGNTAFHHWAARWGFQPVSMMFMAERPTTAES